MNGRPTPGMGGAEVLKHGSIQNKIFRHLAQENRDLSHGSAFILNPSCLQQGRGNQI